MDISAISDGFDSFIEGAAALVVIYWLLASLSSFVVEVFSSALNIRGNALRLFIIDMVQGELNKAVQVGAAPSKSKSAANRMPNAGTFGWLSGKIDLTHSSLKDFSRNLFAHPLMRALEQPKVDRGKPNTAPAYVPSTIFAKTTLDLLRNIPNVAGLVGAADIDRLLADAKRANPAIAAALGGIAAPLVAALGKVQPTAAMNGYDLVVAALSAVFTSPAGTEIATAVNTAATAAVPALVPPFPAGATADAQARIVADTWLGGPAGPLGKIAAPLPATIAGVVTALNREDIPEALRGALRPLVDAANHDMDRLSNEIALWYDASMQRATGWYKRYTMLFIGIIGFVCAVMSNIDTPRIIAALIKSPALREAGYAAAAQVVNSKDEKTPSALPQQLAYVRTFEGLGISAAPGKPDTDSKAAAPPSGSKKFLAWELQSFCKTGSGCSSALNGVIKTYIELAADDDGKFAVLENALFKESKSIRQPFVATESDYWKLLPFTLESGSSGQILAIIKMFVVAGETPESKKTFARQLQSFCETNPDCSSALKNSIKAYVELAVEDDGKFAAMESIFLQDSKLFWYPDVAARLIKGPTANQWKWPAKTLQAGKDTAVASTGAIIAYSQGIPGVGPVWAVAKAEVWTARDWISAFFGWVLTGLMVSLGAPFWFDLLQQLVNRRGAGPKPDEATPAPIA